MGRDRLYKIISAQTSVLEYEVRISLLYFFLRFDFSRYRTIKYQPNTEFFFYNIKSLSYSNLMFHIREHQKVEEFFFFFIHITKMEKMFIKLQILAQPKTIIETKTN